MSLFPSSIIFPYSATHCHDVCSNSPDRLLSTKSTPLPLVAAFKAGKKDSSRELKIQSLGIPKVSTRYWAFCSLPIVAYIYKTMYQKPSELSDWRLLPLRPKHSGKFELLLSRPRRKLSGLVLTVLYKVDLQALSVCV